MAHSVETYMAGTFFKHSDKSTITKLVFVFLPVFKETNIFTLGQKMHYFQILYIYVFFLQAHFKAKMCL